MISLSGYALKTLRDSDDFILLRGHRLEDSLPILAVTPRQDSPSRSVLRRLENEFAIAAELDSSWAAKPLALHSSEGRSTLILEDPGGHPLDVRVGRGLELTVSLRIAIALVEAIRRFHAHGLVHKDIKPANVFVGEALAVRVTGFGIASRLARERHALSSPHSIAGTFAYMAPEQTGRMNRSVDARSDLYSMGVTLYEMLTGSLPFEAADPMEWIHCHIARPPPPPSERMEGLPKPLEEIVLKLLSKNAEDRYQSASGVHADLSLCLKMLAAQGPIESFALGGHDGPDRLVVPEKLYGREADVKSLLSAFDRVVRHGATELMLLSGYSGVGKSSVVNELQKMLVAQRSLFASGKFDQYKRDIPYATLTQSLRSLVEQILGSSDDALGRWRSALQEALGQNAQLVVDLVPQVELVIGKQPAIQDLSPQDAQSRFQTVMRRFLGAFAQAERPLVLFLDDLQWIDTATLDLLRNVTTHTETRNLLVIGAYRENEVGPTHPLTRTIDDIVRAGVPMHNIGLANLLVGDVTRLIADTMRCNPDRVRSLAQLAHSKTGGNPFFTIQFISTLEQEGLLVFSEHQQVWVWDVGLIAMKGFSDNVVELMVAKLSQLPAGVQNALKQLACLGNSATVATLSAVYAGTQQTLRSALWEAARLEFVSSRDDRYSFTHDRIQEAAYRLIPEQDRAPIHLRIGRVLAASSTQEEASEHLFEIVGQFNRAADLIESDAERRELAELNLNAGRHAKKSTAYATAIRYFAAGLAVLSDASWGHSYQLRFELEANLAECEFLTGNLAAADMHLCDLSGRAANLKDRALIARLRMTLYTTLDRTDTAVEVGLEFLRHVGITWSPRPDEEDVQRELAQMKLLLRERQIGELVDLPLMKDPERLLTVDVLADFLAPATFTNNNLFYLAVLRTTNLSLEHGNCDASACAYALMNIIVRRSDAGPDAGLRFGLLGCELVDARGLDRFKAKVYVYFATFVLFRTKHLRQCRALLKRAVDAATDAGDLTYKAYGLRSLISNMMSSGEPLAEVEQEAYATLQFMRESRFGLAADSLVAKMILIRKLRGRGLEEGLFAGDRDETEFALRLGRGSARLTLAAARYHICKLQAHYFERDLSGAVDAAAQAREVVWSTLHYLEIVDFHFFGALVLAASCEGKSDETRRRVLASIEEHRQQIARWAEECPENHAHREALISAEIARLDGRDADAMRLYENAILGARKELFVQNEAIASELTAEFYRARGANAAARGYLQNARSCYERWGAVVKVRQIDEGHPDLAEGRSAGAPTDPSSQELDLAAVLKSSQAVSGEIVLDRLIEKLMVIAIEHAGADRGLLIFSDSNELRIQAEAVAAQSGIQVGLQDTRVSPVALCEPILRYVVRTRESVILDDAPGSSRFSDDEYIRTNRVRSILCLPLIRQSRLAGALYLENRLTSHVFTPERIVVLRALASQAAISLQNARLYSDLEVAQANLQASHDRMQMLASVVENSSDFIGYKPEGGIGGYINAGGRRMVGVDPDADVSEFQISDLRPAEEDRRYLEEIRPALERDGRWAGERYLRHFKTNASIPVLQNLFYILDRQTGERIGIASICKDISEQRRANEALRKAQADLAEAAQRMTMGEFAATIAHELNQPLMAIVTSAETSLLRLQKNPPEIDAARRAAERVVRNGHRASDVIKSIRALLQKSATEAEEFDLNRAIRDAVELTRPRLSREGVAVELDVPDGETRFVGNRVQLQQVVINLILNAVEAMSGIAEWKRQMWVQVRRGQERDITISVEDSGKGLDPASLDRIFDAFFTTKAEGMGMGLAICRTIVEMHGGRLWASPRQPDGSVFQLNLPVSERL
ncbi:hypothetical protein BSZ21_17670 [Bradyrhizobium canariense]|uniref:trifunctional serine/threonine-protein kinase/ATP-binding protein/sensor histidine kinase n=1 Tax=Bradyrhizobium canariense TaxID=255045 RepID=UPI000A1998E4|nr:AAA family ATPase [Bradyrhizobium canariense]OSI67416.1 hypothetical protein BSZ21_17670 [Bradyrhizobium canariense]